MSDIPLFVLVKKRLFEVFHQKRSNWFFDIFWDIISPSSQVILLILHISVLVHYFLYFLCISKNEASILILLDSQGIVFKQLFFYPLNSFLSLVLQVLLKNSFVAFFLHLYLLKNIYILINFYLRSILCFNYPILIHYTL